MSERRVVHRLSVPAPAALSGRRTAGITIAVLGCAFVLALALGSAPGRVGTLPGRRIVTTVATDALIATFALSCVIALFIAAELRAARREQEAQNLARSPWWERFVLGVVLLATAAAAVAVLGTFRSQAERRPSEGVIAPGAQSAHAQPNAHATAQTHWPLYAALAAGALAGVVLLGVLYRRDAPQAPPPRDEEAVRDAAARGLVELEAETDPRRAVIRSYAAMESAFGEAGLPRSPAETPEEYLARILARDESGARAADRLTPLYERAKFSRHEIDEGMRREAVTALRDLQRELER